MNNMKNIYKSKVIQILYILLLGLFLSSCSGEERMIRESEIMVSIEKIIEDGKKVESDMKFSLVNLQAVEWDELYIFGPYTPSIDIEKKIGAINAAVKEIDIEVRDDISLLIFMQKGKLVAVVPYPRQKADFSRVASGTQVLKEESFFTIVESADEQEWFYVELAQ